MHGTRVSNRSATALDRRCRRDADPARLPLAHNPDLQKPNVMAALDLLRIAVTEPLAADFSDIDSRSSPFRG